VVAASIIDLKRFAEIRKNIRGTIVATSGGYDPIHPGHISCIMASKRYGDCLVVIVNGDNFLINKRGKPFMDLQTRSSIVSSIVGVDYVIPFEIENDPTVCEALKAIRPDIFTKGGDRIDHTNIPEWDICQSLGIKIISGVGYNKRWHSSAYLDDWAKFMKDKSNNVHA